MIVDILRGPPGSGKSYWAEKLRPNAEVVGADQFFLLDVGATPIMPNDVEVYVDGQRRVYRYDPAKISQAHAACMKQFSICLNARCPEVVVSNTNTKLWEFEAYEQIAKMMGYRVEVHEFIPETVGEVKLCAMRNCHRVPSDVILRMVLEFEPYPLATQHRILGF